METILYFVVPPAALYLVIVLLVVGPKLARRPRYRVGQPWPFQPMWWTANPQGAQPTDDRLVARGAHSAGVAHSNLERGGARGNW